MKSALWNTLFGLFFAALVLKGAWLITDGARSIPFISLLDLILITLAVFRLVRLTTYDIITKFIRDAVGKAKPNTFLGTFSNLLTCPWCTGLWFAFFVVFAYFATPMAYPIIIILAVAGVASLVQVFANLIGWQAEGKKREVLKMNDSGSISSCG
jgi:hypothetical protein